MIMNNESIDHSTILAKHRMYEVKLWSLSKMPCKIIAYNYSDVVMFLHNYILVIYKSYMTCSLFSYFNYAVFTTKLKEKTARLISLINNSSKLNLCEYMQFKSKV